MSGPPKLRTIPGTLDDELGTRDTVESARCVQSSECEHHANGAPVFSKESFQAHLPSSAGSDRNEVDPRILGWRGRVRHFTWAFFTMTMSTGGIANVINSVPFRFHGLYTIGCIFAILNIVLFIFNLLMISLRFHLYPYTFRASFLHPTESLFVPTSLVTVGTIIINITQYGLSNSGYWLQATALVLFWIYAALSFLLSFGTYLLLWSTQTFTISSMTPAWIFPAYPLLLVGTHAGSLCPHLSPSHSLTLIVGGITLQLLGFIVAFLMYAAYIYRLMTQKLPKEISRPSMFVSVGPAGFTATALIIVAKSTTQAFPDKFMGDGTMAAMISKVMANWFGICLWGLALWFFFISLFSNAAMLTSSNSKFTITWWSFVFPNTALVTATFAVGDAFNSHHLKIIGCVLTCILICVWGFTMAMMIRAIYIGEILMPQKGEDRDEGGWKEEHATRQLGSKTREEARKKRQEKNEGRRGRRWRNQEKDEEEGHA